MHLDPFCKSSRFDTYIFLRQQMGEPFVGLSIILHLPSLFLLQFLKVIGSVGAGEYLALTGETLNGVEMLSCELATHYSHSARVPFIEEKLGKLVTDNPSVIETSLEKYGDLVYPDEDSVVHRFEAVDSCFSHDTVEEIIDALIREGRFQTLDDCLVHEYRMSLQCISKNISSDFIEGVRARVVEKDLAPKWDPPTIEQVSEDMVEAHFSPL